MTYILFYLVVAAGGVAVVLKALDWVSKSLDKADVQRQLEAAREKNRTDRQVLNSVLDFVHRLSIDDVGNPQIEAQYLLHEVQKDLKDDLMLNNYQLRRDL